MEWLFFMGLAGWLLTTLVILLLLSMWKSYRSYTVFAKMGIPSPRALPILGNTIAFFKHGTNGTLKKFNEEFGKIYGLYMTTGPTLVIADLDMVKEILVKQFQYFPDRTKRTRLSFKPWKDFLNQTKGNQWKNIRSTLSPTFSSHKIKRMVPGIQQVSLVMKDYLKDKSTQGEMIELKELCGRFSMDVIGAVAFGMDISSIQNPRHDFLKQAWAIANPNKLQLTLAAIFPKLWFLLAKLGIFGGKKKAEDFFVSISNRALKDRQTDMQSQKYHDFLQLLVESETEGDSKGAVDSKINHETDLLTSDKWPRKGLTKDEMVANAFGFLLAGFDTVSTTLSFTLFCLAHNPQCLKEAQEEVDSILGKSVVTYETAHSLTYLEMCINETMRMYPAVFVLRRVAVDEVEIKGVKFTRDMEVLIPVCVMNMDPEVWPEPDTFDPMRFTAEERARRHPMSFIPFGMGPRNCIAMRLAQLEMRMALATLLQHVTPVPCHKSVYPPKLVKFQIKSVDGLWLRLEKRE